MNKLLILLCLLLAGCGNFKGERGAAGAPGPGGTSTQGPKGDTGAAGLNATPTYAVQFCPSAGPTVYPTNFPENGICVSNKLYAVYSSGGQAWLAEIVPGVYNTTTTGLNCTFTVLANCQVQ